MSDVPLILSSSKTSTRLQGILEDAPAEAGFETDILSSAEEALTLFMGGTKKYKALVTDVRLMGRLSGWDVARRMREADPTFPVIYMTGAAADQWASQGGPRQHPSRKTIRTSPAHHGHFAAPQHRKAAYRSGLTPHNADQQHAHDDAAADPVH